MAYSSTNPPVMIAGGFGGSPMRVFAYEGVDIMSLAANLQREGTLSFVESWMDLLDCLVAKSKALRKQAPA